MAIIRKTDTNTKLFFKTSNLPFLLKENTLKFFARAYTSPQGFGSIYYFEQFG